MVATLLRRGMLAGLAAGLLAGVFAFAIGEPLLDSSVKLEKAAARDHASAASGGHHEKEIFSRTTQKAGLFFVTALFGVTSGGVFGTAYAFFRPRLRPATEWGRSLAFAGAAFVGVFLIPFAKYPANPPGVGDPATIGARTAAYFVLVGLSLAVVAGAWAAARTLRKRGVGDPARHLLVASGVVALLAAAFLALPAPADPGRFPAGLLWEFRLSSLGTQAVFWTALGVVFGLLGERAARGKQRSAF